MRKSEAQALKTALLKARIRADETMSLPVRNLKLELMKRMKDEVLRV